MKNHFLPSLLLCLFLVLDSVQVTAQHNRRFVAEWESAWGTLIRWPLGIPSDLVVELAKDDSLYVLVANTSQQEQAIYTFSSWNVNMDHCQFIVAPTNSHWTRDWGPHYVFNEAGVGGIADPVFDGYPWVPGCFVSSTTMPESSGRSGFDRYESDNLVNGILAENFNVPLISLPIYLTGGNVMVDGHRTAIATQQMMDENYPGIDEATFRQIAADSLGITNFIIVDNPEVHGIQHIDCYAKFLDEETILVKQVDPWHAEYNCCEALATHLGGEQNAYGEPYHIVRIYCGNYSGSNSAAYTNSLILNNKVLVPLFGILEDQQALQVYEQAMPGYEVIGFEWGAWYYYDALHCRTMGIFDRYMLRIEHRPLRGDQYFQDLPLIKALIDDRSETGLNDDELKLYWREQGNLGWNTEILLQEEVSDSLYAMIPDAELEKTYDYFLSAADASGRQETKPQTAPASFYSFTYAGTYTGMNQKPEPVKLSVEPSIFSHSTRISYQAAHAPQQLAIYSPSGVKVRQWNILPTGNESVNWDGTDQNGTKLPPGIYLVKLKTGNGISVTKCILR
jgi:agmatine deiminase